MNPKSPETRRIKDEVTQWNRGRDYKSYFLPHEYKRFKRAQMFINPHFRSRYKKEI